MAKESGEALAERVGTPTQHASLGDVMPLIAAGFFGAPGASAPGIVVDVRDTGGTADGAREALEAFAADPDVLAVIG